MKKFTIIFALFIACTITANAQYSDATLNGAWLLYQAPLNPYGDSLMYLVFDGNGNITGWSGFGSCAGSNYSVNSSGVITGSLAIGGSMPITGQLNSQNTATLSADGTNYELSRVSDPAALTNSITGTLSTDNCGQANVTITIDNQGTVTSATGLTAPISGRIYADLGVFIGHITTGGSNGWNEFSITGYYSNNILSGIMYLDNTGCGNTSAQLTRENSSSIFSANTNSYEINIFPNPAHDILTFSNKNLSFDAAEINIYNQVGSLVKSETIKQYNQQINIGDLSNGIYLVKIISENKIITEKLIKQ